MATDHADFIAKLRQIEELASGVHTELPQNRLLWRTRVQHIVVLAKTLRGRLEFGGMSIVAPGAASPGEPVIAPGALGGRSIVPAPGAASPSEPVIAPGAASPGEPKNPEA